MQRSRKYSHIKIIALTDSELARLNGRVVLAENGCLLWTGAKAYGYGMMMLCRDGHQRTERVHRLAYEHYVGPIPEGLTLDHLCRNRACVNPLHLEPVTNRENILRGTCPPAINARKTHCKHGHPLSGSNLKLQSKWRRCLTCISLKYPSQRSK